MTRRATGRMLQRGRRGSWTGLSLLATCPAKSAGKGKSATAFPFDPFRRAQFSTSAFVPAPFACGDTRVAPRPIPSLLVGVQTDFLPNFPLCVLFPHSNFSPTRIRPRRS